MGKSILSGRPAWAGPKNPRRPARQKYVLVKFGKLLKVNAYLCLCMLVHVCTVCVRVLKMLTLSRENGVFGVKTCSLILFRSTLKIKKVKMR